MNRSETTGAWIAGGVLACAVAGVAYFLAVRVGQLVDAGRFDAKDVGSIALVLGSVTLGLGAMVGAFRRGQAGTRWVAVFAAGMFAAGIIGAAFWMTTLNYPNAISPEERAAMQQDDRDELPQRVL